MTGNKILGLVLFFYIGLLVVNLYLIKVLGVPSFLDDIVFSVLFGFSIYRGLVRRSFLIALTFVFLALIFSFFKSVDRFYPNLIFGIRDYYFPLLSMLIGATFGGRLSYHQLRNFVKFILICLMLSLIVGLLFPGTELAVTYTSEEGPDSLRVGLFFTNPNTLAYFLCIALIIIISAEHISSSDRLFILMMVIILLFTTSRSGLGVFVLLLAIRFGKQLFAKPFRATFTILAVYVLFSIIIPILVDNFESLRLTRYSSIERIFKASARVEIWLSHLEANRSLGHLFFGNGASVLSRPDGYDSWVVFDSVYLKYFLEIGFFGILCYLISFIILFKNYKNDQSGNRITFFSKKVSQGKFIFLSLIFFLTTAGLVSNIMDVYPINYIVFLLIGILIERKRFYA